MAASSLADARLERLRILRELQQRLKRQQDFEAGAVKRPWREVARPDQLAPPGEWMTWLILAGRGWGKALALDTPIPTPAGWTKMGDIKPGDVVFDEMGKQCSVTATFDSFPAAAYRLTFSDNSSIDACSEHQWVTWTARDMKALNRVKRDRREAFPENWPAWKAPQYRGLVSAGPRIRTTQEIADTLKTGTRGTDNHCIPVCGRLELPEADLPLHPYVLGVWLGDGFKGDAGFCTADPEVVAEIESCGYLTEQLPDYGHQGKARGYRFRYRDGSSCRPLLRRMKVWNDKHVPADYLRASAEQRLALLQGLMDSDGGGDAGRVGFGNTNFRIACAVLELARSLGQKPIMRERRALLYGKDCGPMWEVTWRPTIPVFRLPRKLTRTLPFDKPQAIKHRHRVIRSVKLIDSIPMRCLTVDSPNHMFLAGESMIPTHNSRTAAEWAAEKGRQFPHARIALVGKTFADVRDTMIEGESGLLACFSRDEFRNHSEDDGYNRSLGEVRLFNGTVYKSFSAEKPWRLRGPQHHFAWADEACFWKDAHKGLIADTTWSNLVITLRLRSRPEWQDGYRPQVVVATTPRPVALLKTNDPDPSRTGLMQRETTIITRGRTADNLENLSESYKENVVAPLLGTRLGRQELDAELLEDNEAALWRRDWIEETRITTDSAVPDLIRIVVGVDPAVTDGESSAQTGIIVAGAAKNGHGYVLADYTLRGTPKEAMTKVVQAYNDFNADRVVAEVNNGGDYIATLLKTVDPEVSCQSVRASRGKAIRAEPVSSLYEQRRIHHVGSFPYLEDSLCFAAGTKITTARGDVNVEEITASDLVLTRAGWQHVSAAGCTGVQQTVTVTMSDGRTIVCTPSHPIFIVGRGFTTAQELQPRDRIITCIETRSHDGNERHRSHSLTTMVNDITSGLAESTTGRLGRVERGFFTETYMRTTSGQFQLDGSCITPTTIERITTQATSLPCQKVTTSHIISKARSLACMPRQVNVKAGSLLTAGRSENNDASKLNAWNVVPYLSRQECVPHSAHALADDVTVFSVQENAEPNVVYNLTVANQPEYFANGILVHNCSWTPLDPESPDRLDAVVWAITALKDLIGGSYLAAYGVIRCDSCKNVFTQNDPTTKKPREVCPRCSSPIIME